MLAVFRIFGAFTLSRLKLFTFLRATVSTVSMFCLCLPADAQLSAELSIIEQISRDSTVQIVEQTDSVSKLHDSQLFLWKGKPCLISENSIWEINAKYLTSAQQSLEFKPVLLRVSQDDRLFGITSEGPDDYVFIESNQMHGFEKIKLPVHVAKESQNNLILAACGGDVLLLLKRTLFHYDGTKWETKTLPRVEGTFYFPNEMQLCKGIVYLRYNFGHHGGGLLSFDLATGDCKKVFDKSAVTAMQMDTKGRLWFTHKDSEGGIVHGALSMLEEGKLSTRLSEKTEPTLYSSLGLCKDESVLIGTQGNGILKFNHDKTEKLTPDWNAKSFITSILPISDSGNEFCFFSAGHGVIVSSNLVDAKLRGENSSNLFVLNMKKYFFQTEGNKKLFEDTAVCLEKAGKLSQAAAFYLLASIDFSNENDDKSAERMIACAQRSMENASPELLKPFSQELFVLSSTEHIKSIKFRKFLCQTMLYLYKIQKLPEDRTYEAAQALLKLFPEDVPLLKEADKTPRQAEKRAAEEQSDFGSIAN